ncbi:MAG: antibiotic biosynthesis monooxygenase [Actinobacteria bacterium]|nr:antibiotic biosynthesis monooxygenase [Actinomycetota bacterium]
MEAGPATVVVSQRVKRGQEEPFREWQDGINRTAASFTGFLGTEVVPPAEDGDEWTILYRFDSQEHLEAWLGSPERAQLLDRGAQLFEKPQSQQVLIGEREERAATVVVSHAVDPAREDEFRAWTLRLTEAERAFPGFRGTEMFPPVPGVQDKWTIVFHYDTEEHLNGWLESPQRQQLLEEGRSFQDYELRRISSPFGAWFALDGGEDGAGPAQWKTALAVLVGLYPTVVLLTLGISEIWDGKLWATLLVGNILSVTLLTWVVMPVVTRALRFWLAPEPGQEAPRLDTLGAVVSIAFLTLAALVFWLVTTQIWTLP